MTSALNPAQLIASNLAALPHPDGSPRQLAGYSSTLMPDALREQVDKAALDIGESVIHLLETSGYRIVPEGHTAADTGQVEDPDVAHLHCSMCDTRILSINLTNPAHAVTDGRTLLSALAGLSPECPHARI